MGIIQNEVVWIKNKGAAISLCIVNFAIIAKTLPLGRGESAVSPPNLHIDSPLAMKERKIKRTYKTIKK